MHLSYSVATFLKMISRQHINRDEEEGISAQTCYILSRWEKKICKMRVYSVLYHLKKNDATFFVHKMGMVVFLTLIALRFVWTLRTIFQKSSTCRKCGVQTANNRDAGFLVMVLTNLSYYMWCSCYKIYYLNKIMKHTYELYAHGLCLSFFGLI